jgi:hypothetical protein
VVDEGGDRERELLGAARSPSPRQTSASMPVHAISEDRRHRAREAARDEPVACAGNPSLPQSVTVERRAPREHAL